jgi:3-dehydroquinate synthase
MNLEMNNNRSIPVELADRSYEIVIADRSRDDFAAFVRRSLDRSWGGRGCKRCLIVTDRNVARLAAPFENSLRQSGIEPDRIEVEPGESTKSLAAASTVLDLLVELKADRHFAIVALGGGVIGDLAGFVAAIYARGVPLIMIPTSLLAQVDSSVGGKTGVNHPRVKNIIGAFHQPSGVWIDVETLQTLPDRELASGAAEVVKYGVIQDLNLFEFMESSARRFLNRDRSVLERIVARSCAIKAEIVSGDEREQGGAREILNFGHTIGHAIEAVAGYDGRILHGEAVSLGMIAEARLAESLGLVDSHVGDRLERLLNDLGLPIVLRDLDFDRIIEAMRRDKKNRNGRIRFILPRSIGAVEGDDLDDIDAIGRAVDRLRPRT